MACILAIRGNGFNGGVVHSTTAGKITVWSEGKEKTEVISSSSSAQHSTLSYVEMSKESVVNKGNKALPAKVSTV